jgi:hypothetical protein
MITSIIHGITHELDHLREELIDFESHCVWCSGAQVFNIEVPALKILFVRLHVDEVPFACWIVRCIQNVSYSQRLQCLY